MSPRFILFKRADSAGDNWTIFDTERDSVTLNIGLQPNLALDEQTFGNRSFEVKSNGFKDSTDPQAMLPMEFTSLKLCGTSTQNRKRSLTSS